MGLGRGPSLEGTPEGGGFASSGASIMLDDTTLRFHFLGPRLQSDPTGERLSLL